jgi:hypothetical protein
VLIAIVVVAVIVAAVVAGLAVAGKMERHYWIPGHDRDPD